MAKSRIKSRAFQLFNSCQKTVCLFFHMLRMIVIKMGKRAGNVQILSVLSECIAELLRLFFRKAYYVKPGVELDLYIDLFVQL